MIEVTNRIDWNEQNPQIGQKVKVRDICNGIFTGEQFPVHSATLHSHKYGNPIIIEMDEEGKPQKKVTLLDNFNMWYEEAINETDTDYQIYIELKQKFEI